jgi:hypothetical protein
LAFYTADYTSLGVKPLPFNIVGTDPAKGAATTTIPTVIVPIKIVYHTVDGVSQDGTNVVPAVENSPIFLTADYTAGTTDLGVMQYGDAMQRAQFWRLPTFSPNYHVLLGTPAIAPTVTLKVTSQSQGNLYLLRSGALLGVVARSFLNPAIDALTASYRRTRCPFSFWTTCLKVSTGPAPSVAFLATTPPRPGRRLRPRPGSMQPTLSQAHS